MNLADSLERLADQNHSGVGFLVAYALTWLLCAVVWRTASARMAAYVTLFQGAVAFPLALALSWGWGALGVERPVPDEITQLSVLMGTSQLLGLPLLILFVVRGRHGLVPIVFAVITSMHFVMYSWLHQTAAYLVMAVGISVGATMAFASSDETDESVGASRTCAVTGVLLGLTAVYFVAT